MSRSETVRKTVDTVAKDVARQRTSRAAAAIAEPAEQFKVQASEQIVGLASQIRQLGSRLERSDEAHQIARRLEQTADYLRYRPAPDVAGDAWDVIKRSPTIWVGGGLMAGLMVYFVVRGRRRSDT
ncbi:MAG TPA: hypothetical protein VLT81_17025 [Chondromyces sp.]|nr:hypothetical protein [Chondromyces sp.]